MTWPKNKYGCKGAFFAYFLCASKESEAAGGRNPPGSLQGEKTTRASVTNIDNSTGSLQREKVSRACAAKSSIQPALGEEKKHPQKRQDANPQGQSRN